MPHLFTITMHNLIVCSPIDLPKVRIGGMRSEKVIRIESAHTVKRAIQNGGATHFASLGDSSDRWPIYSMTDMTIGSSLWEQASKFRLLCHQESNALSQALQRKYIPSLSGFLLINMVSYFMEHSHTCTHLATPCWDCRTLCWRFWSAGRSSSVDGAHTTHKIGKGWFRLRLGNRLFPYRVVHLRKPCI